MNIGIIGAGEIGQAVMHSISDTHKIKISDRNPDKISGLVSATEAAEKAEIVFYCVPSSGVRQALIETVPVLHPGAMLISLTKGIEAESGMFINDLFYSFIDPMRFALLSGPMLAKEFGSGQGAAAVVGSRNPEALTKLKQIFKPDYIRLEYSNDVRSVALSGVLKNVYSVLFGISDGLGYGNNVKGFLVGKVMAESVEISRRLKISEKIFLGEAGMADFIATAFSPYSMNRQAGMDIAKNGLSDVKNSEGYSSFPALIKMLGDISKLQALSTIKQIVVDGKEPLPIIQNLIFN